MGKKMAETGSGGKSLYSHLYVQKTGVHCATLYIITDSTLLVHCCYYIIPSHLQTSNTHPSVVVGTSYANHFLFRRQSPTLFSTARFPWESHNAEGLAFGPGGLQCA